MKLYILQIIIVCKIKNVRLKIHQEREVIDGKSKHQQSSKGTRIERFVKAQNEVVNKLPHLLTLFTILAILLVGHILWLGV